MRGNTGRIGTGLLVFALAGCIDAGGEKPKEQAVAQALPRVQNRAQMEQELRDVHAEIFERVDSVAQVLGTVPGLTREERGELRSDVNAEQIARARALGVRASDSAEIKQLRDRGRLVPLEDSTRFWVLRNLQYSVPYVTPDTKAMLAEIGHRFHAELDSLGLPPFRVEITSVLRTPETQADLRQSNANASQGVSAHEFGTTLDIARAHFTAPQASQLEANVASAPALTPQVKQVEAAALDSVAEKHSSALQAALGRVLVDMRKEGKLLVMMERSQAVYHTTVAKRY